MLFGLKYTKRLSDLPAKGHVKYFHTRRCRRLRSWLSRNAHQKQGVGSQGWGGGYPGSLVVGMCETRPKQSPVVQSVTPKSHFYPHKYKKQTTKRFRDSLCYHLSLFIYYAFVTNFRKTVVIFFNVGSNTFLFREDTNMLSFGKSP